MSSGLVLTCQAGIVSGLASTAAVAGTFGTYGSAVFSLSMITRTAQVEAP